MNAFRTTPRRPSSRSPSLASPLAALTVLVSVATAACSGGGGPPLVIEAPGDVNPDTPAAAAALADSPETCGCGLCEEVASDDACDTDDDCAPSSPCHASACVASDRADLSASTCDERVVCASADANRCGCSAGRCALIPRGR